MLYVLYSKDVNKYIGEDGWSKLLRNAYLFKTKKEAREHRDLCIDHNWDIRKVEIKESK